MIRFRAMPVAFAAIFFAGLPQAGRAQPLNGAQPALERESFVNMGSGTLSCARFLAAPPGSGDEAMFANWTNGFLSGLSWSNALRHRMSDKVAATTDTQFRTAWLRDYCRANPRQDFLEASAELYYYLSTNGR